ncbi:AraC family transcriptional regulator [Pseudoalteromonas mariniglutinosa]|uniref:AraC family transcriptional regulator n=1 Tax=Pseudoalteromonas mariniglutinosa TaxID=206042 RepID=UPI00384CF0C4
MNNSAKSITQRFINLNNLPQAELRSTKDSNLSYKAHSHSRLSIGVITQGKTQLHWANTSQQLNAGDLVVIAPELIHACNPIAGLARSYHMFYFDTTWSLAQLASQYQQPISRFSPQCVKIQNPALFTFASHLCNALTSNQIKQETSNQVAYFARTVIQTYCTADLNHQEIDPIYQHIKSMLLNDLGNSPSLASLAAHIAQRPETIIRNFNKQFGTSPKALLTNARIEHSKQLLRAGNSIVDSALAVGFQDQSQFHKAFVKYCSATPKQYQQAESIFDNT